MTTETTPQPIDGITYAPSWHEVAEASQEAERETKTEAVLRLVSVPLTDAELADKARELAAVVGEIDVAKSFLKEEAARLRDAVKALEKKQAQLAEEVTSGTGAVEIACKRIPIWEQNAWRVVREDTGEEIGLEPMGMADRQLTIDDALGDEDEELEAEGDLESRLERALDEGRIDAEEAAALAEAIDSGETITDPEAVLAAAGDEPAAPKRKRARKASAG